MKTNHILICIFYLLFNPLIYSQQSKSKVAVLDFRNEASLKESEGYYITDLVRGIARKTLPDEHYIIMTKENILSLLPNGTTLVDCIGECAVDIGRKLEADYVVSGQILLFGGELRISFMLHDTKDGNLLSSGNKGATKLLDLEKTIEDETFKLFQKLPYALKKRTTTAGGASGTAEPIEDQAKTEFDVPEVTREVVRFESNPKGAAVMIDGVMICQEAPCSREVDIGMASVSMQKERYFPREETVEIKKGMGAVSWELKPNFGWLTVESEPSGLVVRINGEDAGITPVSNKEMAPGGYEVMVSDAHYYDRGERIVIAAGMTKKVAVVLTPRQGGINVSAKTVDGNAVKGDVFVDGSKVGATPGAFRLIVGEHNVEVRSDAGNWSKTIEVKEKVVTDVMAEIKGQGIAHTDMGLETGTVTDIDGNIYQTVKIGKQWWMAENLKVTHYRDGNPIPNVTNDSEWMALRTGAYCSYDNNMAHVPTYGLLYNWYAVDDSRKIAPQGWHVPSDAEWETLVNYIGGSSIADGKMKETGTTHWRSPNTGATNESGFTALPGGYRYNLGYFYSMCSTADFWSATEYSSDTAWRRNLRYNHSGVSRGYNYKPHGFSVRCVRD